MPLNTVSDFAEPNPYTVDETDTDVMSKNEPDLIHNIFNRHTEKPVIPTEVRYPGGNLQVQLTRKFLDQVVYYLRMFIVQWTKQFSLSNIERDQQATLNLRMIRDILEPKLSVRQKLL